MIPEYELEPLGRLEEYNVREEYTLNYSQAAEIVAHLIADSKLNLVNYQAQHARYFKKAKGDNVRNFATVAKYFRDSRQFLLNKDGSLEFFLSLIEGIDQRFALQQLAEFANIGYKSFPAGKVYKRGDL